jgi:SHS2 domain-containing protein
MVKYKILSHTADLRLEVFGKTLEELFKNAVDVLSRILYKRSINGPALAEPRRRQGVAAEELKETIKIQSVNLNALLVDFLNEILARSQINKAVYKVSGVKCQVSGVSASVEAELVGQKVEEFEEDIKAVTYHEVNLQQTIYNKQQLWQTKLVLDI